MHFFLSKFLWYFFNPFSFFIFFLTIGLIFFVFKKYRIALYIFLVSVGGILIIVVFPLGNFAINLLEKEFHSKIIYPKKIDGILILSGATNPYLSHEHNSIELNASAERLTESVFLIKKYKNAKIIFSGGSGSLGKLKYTHSKVAKVFFNKMNINNRIIYENHSRNTYENILFSKKIAQPKKGENWLLVTSASHMKRAILISNKQNWKFIPYPVDFNQPKVVVLKPSIKFFLNFVSFQKASHEWMGLIAYYLMGRTDEIF
tara:strand:+ start:1783 stop:2562 length:780 start_codon:yes stop_codon:yes gene_type:complete